MGSKSPRVLVAAGVPGPELLTTSLLSDTEIQRMQSLRTKALQQRFTLRRNALRVFLGTQLDCDPSTIQFDTHCAFCGNAAHGKPRILGYPAANFSASSTGNLAVFAFAEGITIGIDVCHPSELPDEPLDGFIQTAFSKAEQTYLAVEPSPNAVAKAFAIKEAIGKADGHGLLLDIAEVSENWTVTTLDVHPDTYCVAATSQPAEFEIRALPGLSNPID